VETTSSGLAVINQLELANAAAIDLARPWGAHAAAAVNTDITTVLQALYNLIPATNPNGVESLLSVPGVYDINGASQTGTAEGYNYAGQILLPALTLAQGCAVRLKGPTRPPWANPNQQNGTILNSNATSGYIFDAIPAFLANGFPFTAAMAIFEDLVVRAPTNPQCGGINASALTHFQGRNLIIATTSDGPNFSWTGTLEGLSLPHSDNQGDISLENVMIRGFPIGMRMTEHGVFKNVLITMCTVAIASGNAGHSNFLAYMDVENCPTIFQATSGQGLRVYGFLDVECTQATPAYFINDPYNLISGQLYLNCTSPEGGWPVSGGQLLDLIPAPSSGNQGQPPVGWMEGWITDNFTRVYSTAITTTCQAWPSLHPQRLRAGAISTASGAMSSTNGSSETMVLYPSRPVSRVVSATMALAQFFHSRLVAHVVYGGANDANGIYVDLATTTVTVYVVAGGTTSVYSKSGLIAYGNTYTVEVEIINLANGTPGSFKVWLINGSTTTLLMTYTLSATQSADLAAGTSGPSGVEDGIEFFDQDLTTITAFSTRAIPAEQTIQGNQTSLAGTTAGTAVSVMPFQDPNYKKMVVELTGYENTTGTAQTIAFPTAFTAAPVIVHDDSGGASVSTTTLTLPASMGATKTGWIIVEGF
jgi:hypothetical protein